MVETGEIIGVFLGLQSSSYEYIADILAPYQTNFSLEIGDLLLIGEENERIVARVTQYAPEGELTSFMGLKWLSDVALEENAVGSEIKSKKIRYRVQIKILGALAKGNKFIAGVRRVPHITSKVIKPDSTTTQTIINQALADEKDGIDIGKYSLDNKIGVKFDMSQLNSKRTFIFARAGYGKSNLMKVIASNWKEEYGGLLIFDPEGEYAMTDQKGRAGIMDVRDVILITNRELDPTLKNVYNNKLKIDLTSLDAQFVIPLFVPERKYENIFFMKLMGIDDDNWPNLVSLLAKDKYRADDGKLAELLEIDAKADSTTIPATKNNLIPPIGKLHDPNSILIDIIEKGLIKGKVIIVDTSLLDSHTALQLSSMVIRHVFNKNQKNFTGGSKENLIKATFVVEEAQTVLDETSGVSSFIDLAKEGRKYLLGGIFITQQPKSIPFDILSQADNFFVFHLLSQGDLIALQNANAHYSRDILTQLLSEPVKGKGYMWTSSQPFVLPVQINNFEEIAKPNNSIKIQNEKPILDEIVTEINSQYSDPKITSILQKLDNVEKNTSSTSKTILLFRSLTDEERELLRNVNGLQKNNTDGTEFAVTFECYKNLKNKNLKRFFNEQ